MVGKQGRGLGALHAGHIPQPGSGPQTVHGQERALGQGGPGRRAPERQTGVNAQQFLYPAGLLFRYRFGFSGRHHKKDDHGNQQSDAGKQCEHAAPVRIGQSGLNRRHGRKRAKTAGRHLDSVYQGKLLPGKPQDIGFKGRHQARRYAQADQGAARDQAGQCLGMGESPGTGRGHDKEHDFNDAGAETIEENAQRYLRRGEGNEISGR